MQPSTLERRLIQHFAYRLPEEQLTVSNLKRSMRRALENEPPFYRDQLVIDAMRLLELLGIASRVSDRPLKWIKNKC